MQGWEKAKNREDSRDEVLDLTELCDEHLIQYTF